MEEESEREGQMMLDSAPPLTQTERRERRISPTYKFMLGKARSTFYVLRLKEFLKFILSVGTAALKANDC